MSERRSNRILKSCPKKVLNGPCGGMRSDLRCEISDLKCFFSKNYPEKLILDDGFEEKRSLKPRKPFSKLLSVCEDRIAWIAEIPPRIDVFKKIGDLRKLAADALSVPDNPLGMPHIDPLAFAARLKEETSLEIIVHLTCRDLDRLALKSRILGLGLVGVEHILALTGDYAGARGVFDLDSMRLIYLARLLSDYGIDELGEKLGYQPRIHVGAGMNPHIPLRMEISRIRRKLEAGAEFFISQLVFSEERLKEILSELKRSEIYVPVFAGFLLNDPEKVLKFVKSIGLPAEKLPKTLEKLAEKYLEILEELRKTYPLVGAYISTLGKLDYLGIWSEYFKGSL